MSTPGILEILRVCFFGDGQRSLAGRIAVLATWCLTLAVLSFNALFGLLAPDGNLLIRGVGTLILGAPLLWLYARGKRSVLMARAGSEESRHQRLVPTSDSVSRPE